MILAHVFPLLRLDGSSAQFAGAGVTGVGLAGAGVADVRIVQRPHVDLQVVANSSLKWISWC